jgi:hypothetical protein
MGSGRADLARAALESVAFQVTTCWPPSAPPERPATTVWPTGEPRPATSSCSGRPTSRRHGGRLRRAGAVGARLRRPRRRGAGRLVRRRPRGPGPASSRVHPGRLLGRRSIRTRRVGPRGGPRPPDTKGPLMTQLFGAGIWHFASYVDRYATDGYAEPIGMLEMIDRAGEVGDLSVVDLNYPFPGYDGPLDATSRRASPRTTCPSSASRPRCTRGRSPRGLHEPRPGCPPRGPRPHHRGGRHRARPRRVVREAVARAGRLGLPVPGRPPQAVADVDGRRRRSRAARTRTSSSSSSTSHASPAST